MTKPFIPLAIRYERHINRTKTCWLWEGSANQAGYGQFRIGRSNQGHPVISVHRWAYEHYVAPIPKGKWVLHHCDNPRCSNPKHLYVGTAKQNSKDCKDRERLAKKHAFGARHRTLTDDDVRAIRKDGRAHHIIAHEYDVSECHVSNIRSRKRKAHVPD